jgi:predicted dehydrogenase
MSEKGEIDHVVATFVKHAGPEKRPYYDGTIDVLMSDAINAVDMLRFLCGEPEDVAAFTRLSHATQDEKYVALLRFPGGRTGFLNCHWWAGRRYLTAELHGGGTSAFVEIERELRFHAGSEEPVVITPEEIAGTDARNHTRG